MAKSHDRLNKRRWESVRLSVLERDGWKCQGCGKQLGAAQVDHIVPMEAGGAAWELSNLQTLCGECHRIKTAHDMGTYDADREAWRCYLDSACDKIHNVHTDKPTTPEGQ